MFQHFRSSGLALILVLAAAPVSADPPRAFDVSLARATPFAGLVQGTVLDERGALVRGAAVIALGPSLVADVSDSQGRFSLSLPAGDYVLRAALSGYVSANRQALRVRANAVVERRITLLRAPAAATVADVEPVAPAALPVDTDRQGDSHSPLAWRLRHLPRTVLRDVAYGPTGDVHPLSDGPRGSFVDVLGAPSQRQTTAFFSDADFTGQLNLLTTASVATDGARLAAWSRGVADVVVGAPVGTAGDWSVRAAMGADNSGSWAVLGEYHARTTRRHAVRLGVSYSTQGYLTGQILPARDVTAASRSAAGLRAFDRWRIGSGRLEFDYGARFDRYDYLPAPELFGGHAGGRARVARHTWVVGRVSHEAVAPGADQFLPPSAAGPWLPPARTFSPLSRSEHLLPEHVRTATVGIEQRLGTSRALTARLEWFSQSTTNQLATIFGLDEASAVGHYDVAAPGSVEIVGWRARLAGEFLRHVRGSVQYAHGAAGWDAASEVWLLRRREPGLARHGRETVSTLQASVDLSVPGSATGMRLDYGFGQASGQPDGSTPAVWNGRVNLELRQELPYQPFSSSEWNVLFTLRTLVHDREDGSLYDEMLTVRPPARMTGGLQVRF